jgi:transcriptional regulator with XRE-family HTH domain
VSDNELGAFLRARREALRPAEVGLPSEPRRRTPGLRRAELAALAGVSVEYLTRLEQGRDRRPSAEVIGALSHALRLPFDAHIHLQMLTKTAGGACQFAQPPTRSVRPTILALLNQMEPAPALVLNRLNDVLAFTRGFDRLAGPVGLLDTQPPNIARFVFNDPRARTTFPHWRRVADNQVFHLKTQAIWDVVHTAGLAADLAAAGPAFTERWHAPPALPARTGVERWIHPEVDELRLAYETLELAEADDQRLVVYLAADETTSAALDRLAGRRPGALHAVGGLPSGPPDRLRARTHVNPAGHAIDAGR